MHANYVRPPASFRADSRAFLRAETTTTANVIAGSLVTFDRKTPNGLELFCKRVTLKSTGMSFAPGGL
uniref:Uncharacterized protein n=1 Tax=Lutzomyia longipalpis TaxID=7200 RepID=A0A1B0GL13_LUTLO